MNVPTEHLLILAAVLFGLGVIGFLVRRNTIIVLASIELMLNAANLTFVAGSRHHAAQGVEQDVRVHPHGKADLEGIREDPGVLR